MIALLVTLLPHQPEPLYLPSNTTNYKPTNQPKTFSLQYAGMFDVDTIHHFLDPPETDVEVHISPSCSAFYSPRILYQGCRKKLYS